MPAPIIKINFVFGEKMNKTMLILSMFFFSSISLMAMHESIKIQKKALKTAYRAKILEHRKDCFIQICHDEFLMKKDFEHQVVELVLGAGDLVSDQEKLNHACENKYYPQRKEIIKKMIGEGKDPNSIAYKWSRTPMSDAVSNKDEEFINFLRQYGAVSQ